MDNAFIIIFLAISVIIILLVLYYRSHSDCQILDIYIVDYKSEKRDFINKILPCIEKYNTGTVVYYLCINTRQGFYVISSNAVNNGIDDKIVLSDQTPQAGGFSQFLLNALWKHTPRGLIYSGHSSGDFIGHSQKKLVDTPELAEIIREYTAHAGPLDFVYFDSCNMGALPWLQHFAGVCNYVVGTPYYYDWTSVLQIPKLYNTQRFDIWGLHDILHEFAYGPHAPDNEFLELMIYAPQHAPTLWSSLQNIKSELFSQPLDKLQLAHIEEDLYDVVRTIKISDIPTHDKRHLLQLVEKFIPCRVRRPTCHNVPHSFVSFSIK